MSDDRAATAILVTSYRGQRTPEETARLAASGRIPRNNAVEVARLLGADIIDSDYMARRATWVARTVAAVAGLPAGQAVEALLRRRTYRSVLAWADRIGLPLALLNKLSRGHQDVVLLSVDLSRPKKRVFLERFGVHSHLRALVASSSVQFDLAGGELGVPPHKLALLPYGVDTRFWRPEGRPTGRRVCAVGWEARDYPTFVRGRHGSGRRRRGRPGQPGARGRPEAEGPGRWPARRVHRAEGHGGLRGASPMGGRGRGTPDPPPVAPAAGATSGGTSSWTRWSYGRSTPGRASW